MPLTMLYVSSQPLIKVGGGACMGHLPPHTASQILYTPLTTVFACCTGWPVKHGMFFWYSGKSDLPSAVYIKSCTVACTGKVTFTGVYIVPCNLIFSFPSSPLDNLPYSLNIITNDITSPYLFFHVIFFPKALKLPSSLQNTNVQLSQIWFFLDISDGSEWK